MYLLTDPATRGRSRTDYTTPRKPLSIDPARFVKRRRGGELSGGAKGSCGAVVDNFKKEDSSDGRMKQANASVVNSTDKHKRRRRTDETVPVRVVRAVLAGARERPRGGGPDAQVRRDVDGVHQQRSRYAGTGVFGRGGFRRIDRVVVRRLGRL